MHLKSARRIAGWDATLTTVPVGGDATALWTAADLEARVDRDAVLRGDVEPPYWAYLWAGARALAHYITRFVPTAGLTVVEIGCGLGLPGLVAARGGGAVTFVDAVPEALAFVTASAEANRVLCATVCADFHTLPARHAADLVLAAEIAYEPSRFGSLADAIGRLLAPGGRALVADGFRTDTRAFYAALARRHLATRSVDLRIAEEERHATVRLTTVEPMT